MIGVPPRRAGEAVKAFVVGEPGPRRARATSGVRRDAASTVQVPGDIEVVDELPHSVAGKVAKGRLPRAEPGVTGCQPRVRLLTKPGCHLCDDARAVVERVMAELGVGWDEVDITTDAELHDEYWEQIPVTLVDGRQHDFWRVDPARLRAALAA